MAPPKKGDKKGGKGGKAKKGNKPAWMSDGLWELSQNLPKLSEFYCGEVGGWARCGSCDVWAAREPGCVSAWLGVCVHRGGGGEGGSCGR